jgi:hypothetical protein
VHIYHSILLQIRAHKHLPSSQLTDLQLPRTPVKRRTYSTQDTPKCHTKATTGRETTTSRATIATVTGGFIYAVEPSINFRVGVRLATFGLLFSTAKEATIGIEDLADIRFGWSVSGEGTCFLGAVVVKGLAMMENDVL